MEVLFIGAIVAGVTALMVKTIQSYKRGIAEAWQEAAQQLGMQFIPGSMMRSKSIKGRIYENRVEVDTYKRSSGQSSKTCTRYRIYFPESLRLGLHLKQQGFMSGVATFFGSQDIEVGDPRFDSDVVIKGTDAKRVVEFLTPSRRLRILRLLRNHPGCEIKDQLIEWSAQGNEKQADRIVGTVRRLAFAATRVTGSGQGDPEEEDEEVFERASQTDEVHDYKGPPAPPSIEPPVPIPPVEEALPEVPEPAPEPVVPEPTPAEPEPILAAEPTVEPTVVTVIDGLDVGTVCKELFASSQMSFDATRTFDERFKGRSVRWTGKLRRVTSYEIDMDFKGPPGTKMMLDLIEVVGAFGRTAQAIVQLPRNAIDDLRSRIGDQVTFEGHLLSCDPIMRVFFISDSKLV